MWSEGQVILRREVLNDGRPWLEVPVVVVRDEPELLATYIAEGTPFAFPEGAFPTPDGRHPWHGRRRWEGHGVLMLQRPGEAHAIWVFWDGPEREFHGWYVNLQEPFRRTDRGYDTQDLELDIWVPAEGGWEWKDAEVLDERIREGRYTADQVEETWAEGAAWSRRAGSRPALVVRAGRSGRRTQRGEPAARARDDRRLHRPALPAAASTAVLPGMRGAWRTDDLLVAYVTARRSSRCSASADGRRSARTCRSGRAAGSLPGRVRAAVCALVLGVDDGELASGSTRGCSIERHGAPVMPLAHGLVLDRHARRSSGGLAAAPSRRATRSCCGRSADHRDRDPAASTSSAVRPPAGGRRTRSGSPRVRLGIGRLGRQRSRRGRTRAGASASRAPSGWDRLAPPPRSAVERPASRRRLGEELASARRPPAGWLRPLGHARRDGASRSRTTARRCTAVAFRGRRDSPRVGHGRGQPVQLPLGHLCFGRARAWVQLGEGSDALVRLSTEPPGAQRVRHRLASPPGRARRGRGRRGGGRDPAASRLERGRFDAGSSASHLGRRGA